MLHQWRRTGFVVVALAGGAILGGCDSLGPEEPSGYGAIFVDLQSPNGDEGAAVFEIQGSEGLRGITSAGGWVFHEETEESIRVVVILPTPGPIQFQLRSDDVGRLPDVRVLQVASPDNELRSLDGYRVDLFQMVDRRVP